MLLAVSERTEEFTLHFPPPPPLFPSRWGVDRALSARVSWSWPHFYVGLNSVPDKAYYNFNII